LSLANAGPETVAAARSFLQASYAPLANAAWSWAAAYGWTAVPFAQMQDYVSGQVYALRSTGAPVDRFGFAWSPSNTTAALPSADFTAQTSAILDRLAASIGDSGSAPAAACAPTGENLWCSAAVD